MNFLCVNPVFYFFCSNKEIQVNVDPRASDDVSEINKGLCFNCFCVFLIT